MEQLADRLGEYEDLGSIEELREIKERKIRMKLNRLVSTSGMDHATWLEYRKKGIGGSDAGSICGLNPYATAISVYQDKTQEEVTEKEDNESLRQ